MVINVTVKDDGTLPTDAADQIKRLLSNLVEVSWSKRIVDSNSWSYDIGDDVPYFSVSVPVNKVIGMYVYPSPA